MSNKNTITLMKMHIKYSLNGANYDLAEWIDERLENITGVQRAEEPAPEVQTVDILPVINWLICFLQTHKSRDSV